MNHKYALMTTFALSAAVIAGCAPQDQAAVNAAGDNPTVGSVELTPTASPEVMDADKAAKEKAEQKKATAQKEKEKKNKAAKDKAAKEKVAKIELASQKKKVDPLTADTDGDSLTDAWEIDHGTNSKNADTDGDGHGDREEYYAGTSLTDKNDYPGKPAPAPAPVKTVTPKAPVAAPAPAKKTPAPAPVVAKPAPVKETPAPAAAKSAPSGNSFVKPQAEAAPKPDGLNWNALAQCESTGNPNAWNPAGYGGLYQFDQQTWASVGGQGAVTDASAAEQTKRAQILYGQRGASPWPHCGKLL